MKNKKNTLPILLALALGAQPTLAFDESLTGKDSLLFSNEPLQFTPRPATQHELNYGQLGDLWQGQSRYHQLNSLQPGQENANQLSIDIKRRLYSFADNTYVAMGLGWDDITLEDDVSTSGMRLVAEGRVGIFGPAYVFGQAALAPWLSDTENYINPFGKELELGLAVDPLPSLSIRAGYRSYWLDISDSKGAAPLHNQTDGFFIGGGLHW